MSPKMKVIVIGGDGFCGWPTSLFLAKKGNAVMIIDNFSRRKIDHELGTQSLTRIASIEERLSAAQKNKFNLSFEKIDIVKDYNLLLNTIKNYKPDAIIHFGEQRAAPYSMIGDKERRYTVNNNISGTHNVCSAIVESNKKIHLIHLGTMGVYGYSKEMGPTPEGYLDVTINQTGVSKEILFPSNPGSIYHMTKSLDQLIFQFYNKNWGLKITDLHQGIVWGTQTPETILDEALVNRFDYDGVYGTVLNRFIVQAVNRHPLTIYGNGGQTRAFIHISDTAKCIWLALNNSNFKNNRVRIFNQVAEVYNLKELAFKIKSKYSAEIEYLDNPRKELSENELEVKNNNFMQLGFEPILLENTLLEEIVFIAKNNKNNFDKSVVKNSPKW
jgi:UDP-sulfoquinovose synthase